MAAQILQGRYELRHLIGSGGMAQVWQAQDRVLQRLVAVKIVDLSGAGDPLLGERLKREAINTAVLHHPDIVTVHDAGIEGSTVFFVMELIAGRDLAAVLREGPLPTDEAVRVTARVCGALAAAHAAGIVHRDVKPANVLVHGDSVTVVDFGIAAMAREAGAALTAPGTVLGTAEYMTPEQADGQPATPASDVYAVGCLLMALLTGRPPFGGDDPIQVLHQHVAATPPRVRDLRPEVSEPLEALVEALLAKDPAARPSAVQAQHRLMALPPSGAAPVVGAGAVGATRILPAGEPTVVLAAYELPRPGRPRFSRPVLLAAAAAVLVLGVTAVALGLTRPGNDVGPSVASAQPAPGIGQEPGVPETQAPVEEPAAPPTAEEVPAVLAAFDVPDRTSRQLADGWREVTDAVDSGKVDKAVDKAAELSAALDALVEDGTLTSAQTDPVKAALVALLVAMPADGDGPGGRGGN